MFVLIANPGDADTTVQATYLLPDGTTVVKSYLARAKSRTTVWVDQEDPRLASTAVSVQLAASGNVPIIVERAMWWPGSYEQWQEAHNAAGSIEAGTRWALAEGEDGGPHGTDTYILFANTSTFAGQVRVTLFFEDGTSAERTFPVAATSRANAWIKADFPQAIGRRFSALVESIGDTPASIVVERAMYSSDGQPPSFTPYWPAGSDAVATNLDALALPTFSLTSAVPGQTVTVTIDGKNTRFVAGLTRVDFGAGVVVQSVTVESPTRLRVVLHVAPAAPLGVRRVRVTSQGQSVDAESFAVRPDGIVPVFTLTSPTNGSTVYTPTVTVTGTVTDDGGMAGVACNGVARDAARKQRAL